MTAAVRAVEHTVTVHIDPDDPVFEGHYPGFAILPGLFLVEYAHRFASTLDETRGLRPVALERVRFRRPVRPGDTVTAALSLTPQGRELVCAADLSVRTERVATLRIRYAEEEPDK